MRSRSRSLSLSHSGGNENGDDDEQDGSIRDLDHAPDLELNYNYYYESFRGAPLSHDPHTLLESSNSSSRNPSPPIRAPQHTSLNSPTTTSRPRLRLWSSDDSSGHSVGNNGGPAVPPPFPSPKSQRNFILDRLRRTVRPNAESVTGETGEPSGRNESPPEGRSGNPAPGAMMANIPELTHGDETDAPELSDASSLPHLQRNPPRHPSQKSKRQYDMEFPEAAATFGSIGRVPPSGRFDARGESREPASQSTLQDDAADDDEEDEPDHDPQGQLTTGAAARIPFFGCAVPVVCTSRMLTYLAEAVARFAPCFVFWGFQHRTARVILKRLNVLLIQFALFQVAAGIFLGIVLESQTLVDRTMPYQQPLPEYDDDLASFNDTTPDNTYTPHGNVALSVTWNLNGKVFLASVVATYLCACIAITWRVVRYVNLVNAVRYYWALAWATPFQTFCVIGLFDYFDVTQVWVNKWWRDSRMAWFRSWSCAPNTYQTLCTVPEFDNVTEETEWCWINYNTTTCSSIRNQAQFATLRFLKGFYFFTAGWGLVLLLLMFLAMDTLEQIISKPLVQKSRQSNIAAWLSLPMLTCLGVGVILILFEDSSTGKDYLAQFRWMGSIYVSISGLFFAAGVLGETVGRTEYESPISTISLIFRIVATSSGLYIDSATIEKTSHKRKQLAAIYLFIASLLSACLLLLTSFGSTFAYSVYVSTSPMSEAVRGNVACFFDAGTCTGCHDPGVPPQDQCPQWSEADVDAIVRSHCKTVATVSAIFMVYCYSLIRFGFNMRRHLATYQIEYV